MRKIILMAFFSFTSLAIFGYGFWALISDNLSQTVLFWLLIGLYMKIDAESMQRELFEANQLVWEDGNPVTNLDNKKGG